MLASLSLTMRARPFTPPVPIALTTLSLLLTLSLLSATTASASTPPPRFTTKKFKTINGRRMAYVEVGTGDPIVFLHGNPTSSYLWRNVMPHLEGRGRLIAPDLIGMGDSDKLPAGDPLRYSVLQHSNYLFQLLEVLGVKKRVTFVIHDWGSVLGQLWAYQRRFDAEAVRGIVLMEGVAQPFRTPDRLPEFPGFIQLFNLLRGPQGERLVLEQNYFVEVSMPLGIIRNLTAAEKAEYVRPFKEPGEGRRPTLTFPREIPINGVPASTDQLITAYGKWMKNADMPKLFIRGIPGLILNGKLAAYIRSWKNVKEVTVRGLHYLQEDSPDEIGQAIAAWLPN